MTDNKITIETQLELADEGFSEAAIGQNSTFQWAKIIITDDKPNLNKQRVPADEFDNLIRTGSFTPIKMAEKHISDGHAESKGKIIGTLASFSKDSGNDTNRLFALAALWKMERAEDISLLKEMYNSGELPEVSWEIAYSSQDTDDDGISTLHGLTLTGVAVVGKPAYGGRTPIIAMSSVNEEESVEETEKLTTRITELESTLASTNEELTTLREYKNSIELEKAKGTLMNFINN